MRKFLKITGIVLGVVLLLLFLAPFLFEDQLKDLVQKTINKNLDAEVTFVDMDVSLFRNFPDATVAIEDLLVINHAPFKGDTLAFSEEVVLEMSVMELFNSAGEPMKVDALAINNTFLNLKIDSLGNANYDIAVPDNAPLADSTAGTGFQFDVEHYEINNSEVVYFDEGSDIGLIINELNHEGTGDFSAETSTLSTHSTALVSLVVDSTYYLDRNKVALEADFMMDLENMKFTFLENEAMINQLPLTFEGYVIVNEDNNEVNLTFETPSSSFKNFLAVIPEEYSKSLETVRTTGDFVVQGKIEGIVDETFIPKFNIQINSENASFKYPELPKGVEDITIDAQVVNTTGIAEDTYVQLDQLNFRIDQDVFRAEGSVMDLMGNPKVEMAINGVLNLASIEKAYPIELEQDLNGIVNANLRTSFDMNSIENEQYQNVNSSGTATIRDFSYSSPEIPNEVKIATAKLNFEPGTIRLEEMVATTGKTDMRVSGKIQNLMGFLFTDQNLKGNFDVNSDTFAVGDFMIVEPEATPEAKTEDPSTVAPVAGKEAIKIPSFLNAQLNFAANTVLYDNLALENVKGNLIIVDETAQLNNVSAEIFGGNFALSGNVSTREEVPTFDMNLILNSINIADSFNNLELFQNLAPIAKALEGELTTNIELHGNLNDDFTPRLNTIAGEALAEILRAEIDPRLTPLLNNLDARLDFIDLDDLFLDDLRTTLSFNNGRVEVHPFDFTVQGIDVTAAGSHGFDMSMDYKVTLELPAELLGSTIGGTLSQISDQDLQKMTVPLPIQIAGNFQDPVIDLNMEMAVSNLTQKIIAAQKKNLKEKGVDILKDILTEGNPETDSATTAQDTTAGTKEKVVKEVAKGILGEIFRGRKKEKDTVQKDTVQ